MTDRASATASSPRQPDVGSSVSVATLLSGGLAIVLVLAGLTLWWSSRLADARRPLVLATGPEEGAYHALGEALARLIEEEGLAPSVEVRATEGSRENMALLEGGKVDLAILQSDTPGGVSARLITPLFDEALHVLVPAGAADRISRIGDLSGCRVSLGAPGSGTRQVAERILDHFDVDPAEDLAVDPAEAIARVESGGIDAVFLLTALPSPAVAAVASRGQVRFLSLGNAQERGDEADALALVYPRLHAMTIPRGTYGAVPREPVRTVGVSAQLVGHRDLDEDLVLEITGALFALRSRLNDTPRELSFGDLLHETYTPGAAGLAYHPGAVAYYERFRPSFIVEYAEPMSLGLTLLVGFWSAALALRGWVRRARKNRIDAYYVEVVRDAPDLGQAGREELLARRDRLVKVRERAFTDLVAERLEANESFSIFQNQVDGELASIQRRLGHLPPGPP
jgi:TRAP transporter TAXI family solute receptor